jgi:glycosyltransferase involved in cell wall biosynthesis
LKILVVTYDLSPPWDSGHKVYGKGLMSSISAIGDEIVVANTRSLENYHCNGFDFVHVILTGFEPLWKALNLFKGATIFKHILTPSVGLRNSITTKACYSLINLHRSELVRCFSSNFVAKSYYMRDPLLIPPCVNTSTYSNFSSYDTGGKDSILTILKDSPVSIGLKNIEDDSNGVVLYSGPLTQDRFPYRQVFQSLKKTKSKMLIIGRTSNYGPGIEKVEEIVSFARKTGLENRLGIALKILTEDEKIQLINYSSVVIQPFSQVTNHFVAVDPPIFLLEAMACGKPVITSKAYSFQEFIRNGHNGYAIDWDDPEGASLAFAECLNNSCVGKNARDTIEQNFSCTQLSKRLMNIYNDHS